MEAFFRTHQYLVEHINCPIHRGLMHEIDWNNRLIGIKGARGVGKTSFLLQYAKENFGAENKECLYVNMNHFYFTERTLIDFANEFRMKGGKVLLIDQIYKYPNWSKEIKDCYNNYTDLRIIFSGSSVLRLKEENPDLSGKVVSHNLRGFSFREYLNLMAHKDLPAYSLQDIIQNHRTIAQQICSEVKPLEYLQDYMHHGYYPFFLEKRNFSENLLKTINMMLEVDVLSIKQIEQSYLPKLRKLLYLLAYAGPSTPNISQLSNEIKTSRATVMNYMKYLKDARLINMLYPTTEDFPKKPAMVYMQNTNLLYPISQAKEGKQPQIETFFCSQVHKDYKVNMGSKGAHFWVNNQYNFKIEENKTKIKNKPDFYYAVDGIEIGEENIIPLWLFGFLY